MMGEGFCIVTPVLRARELGLATGLAPTTRVGGRYHPAIDEGRTIMSSEPGTTDQRVGRLRGAGVDDVDPKALARFAVLLLVLVLAVLVVVLYAAGARKNAQVTKLRDHGVPVVVTVTHCRGELGGSGSNGAGFVCRGAYRLGGRRYVEPIPGNTRYDPGTTIKAVAVPDDPQLVAPAATVAGEHSSATVYVLPTVLLVALLATCGAVLWRWRRRRARSGPTDAPGGDEESSADARIDRLASPR
jgi:hypothetical protein